MEELLQQYAGAYASDASVPGSESSDEEEEEDIEVNSSDCEAEGVMETEEAAQDESSSPSGECALTRQGQGGQALAEPVLSLRRVSCFRLCRGPE